MAGQDAVNAANAFGRRLTSPASILTKADGDARGGAALSVRQITGKPIVFLGVGEKTRCAGALRSRAHGLAHPRHGRCGRAGREVQRNVDAGEAERLARKVARASASICPTCAASSSRCEAWAAWAR